MFRSLTHRFAGDRGVDIVVDRRAGCGHVPAPPTENADDRRRTSESVEAQHWVEGYAVVPVN